MHKIATPILILVVMITSVSAAQAQNPADVSWKDITGPAEVYYETVHPHIVVRETVEYIQRTIERTLLDD